LNSCWTLFKEYRKAAANAQRLLDRLLEILKKGIGKLLGTAPCICHQPIGEEAEWPSGYWKKHGNFRSFFLKPCFLFIFIKNEDALKNFQKLSVAPLLIIFHYTLVRLRLVQQSLQNVIGNMSSSNS
jgi:hypothetical protein